MKNLGINYDGDGDGKDANEEFTTFVKDIYMNCKNFGVNPETLSAWVKDLFDCYSVCAKNGESFSFDASCGDDGDPDLNAGENKETRENKQRQEQQQQQQHFPVDFKEFQAQLNYNGESITKEHLEGIQRLKELFDYW